MTISASKEFKHIETQEKKKFFPGLFGSTQDSNLVLTVA
jgi:hypothetical protein